MKSSKTPVRVASVLIVLGSLLLIVGSWIGLRHAPGELYMGEVQRIMYVHVPTAWSAMLAFTFAFFSALVYLFKGGWQWDSRHEAWVEIGVLLSALLCIQGSIWAKPTWGVWWDWDPRLTTTAVLFFAFTGILTLRKFVDDASKRAAWSAVATIVAFVDVPIVYFSVRWWNSLHQVQSTPETVSSMFHLPLRMNAIGVLVLMIGAAMLRTRIATLRREVEVTPPARRVVTPVEELA